MKRHKDKDADARVCPVPHRKDPDRPRRCAPGLGVCGSCVDRVDRALRELPDMHAELVERHTGGCGGGPKITGTPEGPVPYRDNIGDCRSWIVGALQEWARHVAETRGVARPLPLVRLNLGGPACVTCEHESCAELRPAVPFDEVDLAACARFLSVHRDWLLGSDKAAEFAERITALSSQAYGLLYPSGKRTFVVTGEDGMPARCVETTPEGGRCVGVLSAVLRDSDELLPSAMVCGVCGTEVPAREWVTWARRNRKAA